MSSTFGQLLPPSTPTAQRQPSAGNPILSVGRPVAAAPMMDAGASDLAYARALQSRPTGLGGAFDSIATGIKANSDHQALAAAMSANANTVPGLNSALGDIGISPVASFTGQEPGFQPNPLSKAASWLGGLFSLGSAASAASGQGS